MSLLKRIQDVNKGGADKKYDAFGAVFEVSTAVESNGAVKLTGKLLNESNPKVKAGEEIVVTFRGESASKSLTNFVKGNGKKSLAAPDAAKGTFLTLEGCFFSDEMEDGKRVLSSRWLNTLASSNDTDHDNRSFIENILVTAPRISFKNPAVQPGEPERITLPVNARTVTARVKTDHGTFEKEFPVTWAVQKLEALGPNDKPQVHIDTVEPSNARNVRSRQDLEEVLAEQLGRGTKALALLRVTDGEDVLTRAVYVGFKRDGDEYVPDTEKTLEDLFKNNIFKGIPNDDLFAGLVNGDVRVESIPGYRMNYAGDPTQDNNAAFKLISEVKAGRTQRYEMIFGEQANLFSKVILPGIARTDTISGFSPFNILADEPGTYLANQFSTPLVRPGAEPQPPKLPAEEAQEPAPDFASLESEFDTALKGEEEAPAGPRP
ncbi:TPA: hypothetical protein L5F93_004030 [Pseudomonas aeruginosa]|nr:hypothetical protein [Pseudomonas aeruginosa]HBO9523775.1 hypothetical protein [Pseudomonas aeruginosa]HBO9529908.1 hypothetical protein [Pseudomonas aeruginosa]HBO9547877.1 hypothetical protein [Pseudomonas aeruginosa]HBO9582958.1 hypothetical protein [Pseudomonas aeruginosa]